MLAKFKSKKQNIIEALRRPAESYEDLSPKGNLDEEIRELVEEINNLPEFVTTSSCAGRVAVYLEGESKSQASVEPGGERDGQEASENTTSIASSRSGKGGGKWLFISHKPVDLAPLAASGALLAGLGFSKTQTLPTIPSADTAARFVHMKFEPMILHVLAQSAESAQTLLGSGMAAGFRESGISGIVDSKGRPTTPMVAVRSSGLAMDCIVGFQSPATDGGTQRILPLVSEEYLRTMIAVTNDRFKQNSQRKERFRLHLLNQLAGSMAILDDAHREFNRKGGFQTKKEMKAEKRREDMRRREEALQRRAQALHRGGALDGAADEREDRGAADDGDDLGLGVLALDSGESQRD